MATTTTTDEKWSPTLQDLRAAAAAATATSLLTTEPYPTPGPAAPTPPLPNPSAAPRGLGSFWGTRGSAPGRAGPRGRARSGVWKGWMQSRSWFKRGAEPAVIIREKINHADLAVRGVPLLLALEGCWAGRHFPLAFLPWENGVAVSGVSALPG